MAGVDRADGDGERVAIMAMRARVGIGKLPSFEEGSIAFVFAGKKRWEKKPKWEEY